MGRCDFRKSCGADSLDKRDERSQRKVSGQMNYDELWVMYYRIQLLLNFVADCACVISFDIRSFELRSLWSLTAKLAPPPQGQRWEQSCASSRCISGSISLHLATILDY